MTSLRSTLTHGSDGIPVIALEGSITPETSPELRSVFEDVLSLQPTRVDLNLAGVSYIASAGVGTLISFLRRLKERNSTLRLLNLSPEIRNLFEVTHLDKVFTVVQAANVS